VTFALFVNVRSPWPVNVAGWFTCWAWADAAVSRTANPSAMAGNDVRIIRNPSQTPPGRPRSTFFIPNTISTSPHP